MLEQLKTKIEEAVKGVRFEDYRRGFKARVFGEDDEPISGEVTVPQVIARKFLDDDRQFDLLCIEIRNQGVNTRYTMS